MSLGSQPGSFAGQFKQRYCFIAPTPTHHLYPWLCARVFSLGVQLFPGKTLSPYHKLSLHSDMLLPSKAEFSDHLLCHFQLHSFCRDPVLNMVLVCSFVIVFLYPVWTVSSLKERPMSHAQSQSGPLCHLCHSRVGSNNTSF